MSTVFFPIFIGLVFVVVVVICLLAIVMSSSNGVAWLESVWKSSTGGKNRETEPPDQTDGTR